MYFLLLNSTELHSINKPMNLFVKEDIYSKPFLEEWPKLSFDEIENIQIDKAPVRFFYKSFFGVLKFPQTIIHAFITLLK